LTAGAVTYTGLSTSLSGAGTVNVTLGTGGATTTLNGNYSGFTGIWNVGIGAAAGAAKVQMNGADNAAATINLLTHSTLYVAAAVTKNAALVLNGGDTGETLGQLRLEGNSTWAGSVTLAGNITGTNDSFIGSNTGTATISGAIGETGGARTLSKGGGGTIVLSGANTYTGATVVNAGTLALNYDTQNNSKLSNSAALTLNNGTLQFAGGTTHAEVVGSVTINGAASITRNGANASTIDLGNYTNNGLLNVADATLATTSKTNNATGFLDGTTLGGADLATNSAGAVSGFAGYADVTRQASGPKVITSAAGSVVRIIEGTGALPANITIAGGTTDIGTLFQSTSGGTAASTVDLTGGTLRLGAAGQIISSTGSGALTIQNGVLTAGGAAATSGQISLLNGGGTFTVLSQIADNGAAVSLRTGGNVTLGSTSTVSTNNYTGGTTVSSGTLTVATSNAVAGARTGLGTAAVSVVNGGNLRFFTAGGAGGLNTLSYANAINLTDSTLTSEDNVVTYGGAISLTGANTVNVVYGTKNATFSNVSGTGSLTKTGGGTLTLEGDLTGFSSNIVLGGGTVLIGGDADRTLGNAISGGGAFAKSGIGTLTLTANNTSTGATTITGGTLQIGTGGATGQLGTGSVSLAAGTTLTYNRTGDVSQGGLNSVAAGNGIVNVNGGANLSINGSGNFSGVINVNSGSLIAGASNPWGVGASAPTFNLAAGTTLSNTTASVHAHVGNITMNGATWTTGTGTGSYDTENYQLNGTVSIAGTAASLITRAAGRTDANSGVSLAGNRTFDVADVTGSTAADLTVSTELENTDTTPADDGFTKTGAGTMVLATANSYSGATIVDGGTLRATAGLSLGGTSGVTVNTGAKLETAGTNVFVASHGTAVANTKVVTLNNATWEMTTAHDARIGNVTLNNGSTWTS
ncbi:MAG: autotransporter-associated beta strand repeat-containing protein, partial [Verrucomicrobiota bacterium]